MSTTKSEEDFKFSPGMLKHLKIVASGERRVNALQLLQRCIAGKEICKTLSLGNYQSPQSFQNVSEVFGVDGSMLDGQNSWCFKIGGLQTITFILYYKKMEMYNLLPEKAPLAYGVQMSKGIPNEFLKIHLSPTYENNNQYRFESIRCDGTGRSTA